MKITDIIFSLAFSISFFFGIISELKAGDYKNGWKYAELLQFVISIMCLCIVTMFVCFCFEVRR